ncbi:MAG: hypothetical protein ACK4RM_10595, partial [Flavobacterium sp.]
MKFKILLPLLFALNVNINAQSSYMNEMLQYGWYLSYIIIDGETMNLPTDPTGLQNISLNSESSSGFNSDMITSLNYGGNSLYFNINFHANEPSFFFNYGAATLIFSPWSSFESLYFDGIFLNNGNYEQVNPFNFSIVYLSDAPALFITNNLGNTAVYLGY